MELKRPVATRMYFVRKLKVGVVMLVTLLH